MLNGRTKGLVVLIEDTSMMEQINVGWTKRKFNFDIMVVTTQLEVPGKS